MSRRQPFFCDTCQALVRYPEDRVKKTLDYRTADSNLRFRSIHLARLCVDCMNREIAEAAP